MNNTFRDIFIVLVWLLCSFSLHAQMQKEVCRGEQVILTAFGMENEGENPVYQWFINGIEKSGAQGISYSYIPEDGDSIVCRLVSNADCLLRDTVFSNFVKITHKSCITDPCDGIPVPSAPVLITDPLCAFLGQHIDLGLAIDSVPDFTYVYYANANKTGVIEGGIITYQPPKEDYYVSAVNGACEGSVSKITVTVCCPESVEDEEEHLYHVTALSGLCWTENLRTTLYPGTSTPIPFAKPYTCPACPSQLDNIFGLLYTWYSAMNIEVNETPSPQHQGICPAGWHIPSQTEWNALNYYSAKQLKSTTYWLSPLGPGTDEFGFNALPAGWYNSAINKFENLYGFTGWWASDAYDFLSAHYFSIAYNCDNLQNEMKLKEDGLSVRCVMDY